MTSSASATSWSRVRKLIRSRSKEEKETQDGPRKDIRRTSLYFIDEKKAEKSKQKLHRSHSDSECKLSLRIKCSKPGLDILNTIAFSGTIDEDDLNNSEDRSYFETNERRIKISAMMLNRSSVIERKDENDQKTLKIDINQGKSQEDDHSEYSDDSVFDKDDPVELSKVLDDTGETSFDDICPTYKPTILTSKTCPRKVYPDLLNHLSLDRILNKEYDGDNHERSDDVREETTSTMMEDEEDKYVMVTTKSLPHRMHYLENVVYMSPKRGQNNSSPTTASLVNLNDLAQLQGIHDNNKGKKGNGGSRKNIGKSVLNRLSKKISSSTDNSESIDGSYDPPRSEVTFEVGPPQLGKKAARKIEQKSLESPINIKRKNKPSRMSKRIRRTFNSGSDKLLQQAVSNNDLDALRKLLIQDWYLEEINHLEPPGVTIFHQACVYGDSQVVKLLLNKGADTALLTWSKLSPLKIAVMFGHYEIAELLLDSGADLNDIMNGF